MPAFKDLSGLKDLGDYIRDQRRTSQISLRQLAAIAGVSNPYLSQIERGLRKPSADILAQIAKGLSVSAEAMYVQAGILDERAGDPHVVAAIMGDPGLTDRQKHVLMEIYDSFAAENDERRAGSTTARSTPGAPPVAEETIAAEVPVEATVPPAATTPQTARKSAAAPSGAGARSTSPKTSATKPPATKPPPTKVAATKKATRKAPAGKKTGAPKKTGAAKKTGRKPAASKARSARANS